MRACAWLLVVSVALAACAPADDAQRRGSQPIEPRVAATVEVDRIVAAVSAGAGGIWTANYEDGTVSLVDPARNSVVGTLDVADEIGSLAYDVHATDDAVWLLAERGVGHIDPSDLTASMAASFQANAILDIAATATHVWVSRWKGERERAPIDAFGVEIRSASAVVPLPGKYGLYSNVAAGDLGVWALDASNGRLAAIAPAEGEPGMVETGEPLPRGGRVDLAVGHRSVWVGTSNGNRSRLTRYDPTTSETESVGLDGEDGVLALDADAVWVLTHDDERGFLWKVDAETLSVEGPLVLEGSYGSSDISYGFGSVWITHDTNLLSRVAVTAEGTSGASVPVPELRGSGALCDQLASPWVWCPEARWLRRVVNDAGLEVVGDTGTALKVRAGDLELNAWNTDAARPIETIAAEHGYERLEGPPAFSNGERLLWEAQGLRLYLSSADERSIGDVPDEVLRALIEASERVPMEADLSGAKPQPTPTADPRWEHLDNHRIRVWPMTEDVQNRGRYLFEAPHCGLDWMIDFDGSFWEATKPADYGDGENYPFFYNSDSGVITFTGDDSAVYQASTGEKIELKRLPGPIVTFPCD